MSSEEVDEEEDDDVEDCCFLLFDNLFPCLLFDDFIDLPTFEMPDGTRPFKNFDFKDHQGTRVMGVLTQI